MNYLRLIVCLTLCVFTVTPSRALSDSGPDKSVRILVFKGNDTTAKVTLEEKTYLVPISFENSSFSWNDVKDGYSITPAFASLLEQGRVSIYIGCSGATFHALRPHAKTTK